jgi:putative endonuclease
LDNRLKDHNSGRVKYTKGRRPWVLHYFEEYPTRSEALERERFFKSIDGYNYLKSQNII